MGRQGTPRPDATGTSASRRASTYVRAHRARRRWLGVVGVLAAVVACVTALALSLPASTWTGAASLPEGAQVPEGYTRQYSAQDRDSGVAVAVHAADGVVPDGAQLKVDLLDEDGEKYGAARDALAEQAGEGDDYGFAALDIRFEDEKGNEVEPTGDVYVVIDAKSVLPEDVDPESVTVQHLAEDESGAVAAVDTVADAADATDGVVAANETAVQAAFTVDGFSTFTITWNNNRWQSIDVHYGYWNNDRIDDLNESSQTVSFTDDDSIASFNPPVVDGYRYTGTAYVVSNGWDGRQQREEITDLQYSRSNGWSGGWQYKASGSGNWHNIDQGKEIYFIYEATSSDDGLHTVDTVDSAAEGVHMYMFDYARSAFDGGGYGDGQTKEGLADSTVNDQTGWPTFTADAQVGQNRSFAQFFGSSYSAYEVSEDDAVNHLFLKSKYDEDGTFYYSSFENFATLKNDNDSDFTVYQELGTPSGEDAYFYKRGNFMPYNTLNTRKVLNHNLYDDEGNALSGTDPRYNEPVYGFNENNNFYFGMYVWADFYQPKDGQVKSNDGSSQKDMVFEFTGDDDMWVFIDGVLVLDLGGIHDAQSGSINFATGEVRWTDTQTGKTPVWEDSNLLDIYEKANRDGSTNWKGNTFADGTNHRIQIFYMERGAGASNLKISFNLKTIPDGTLSVEKNVKNYYAPQTADIEYTMQVTVNGELYANQPYTFYEQEGGGTTDSEGKFKLKFGQTAQFENLQVDDKVKVEEVDVGNVPEGVDVKEAYDISYTVTDGSGQTVGGGGDSGQPVEASMPGYGSIKVQVTNEATFTRPLRLTKTFMGTNDSAAPDGFQATYTLYEVGSDGSRTEVGSVRYSDLDENGSYTFWLETGRQYTIVETFVEGEGDNDGGTQQLPWSGVTVTTNDPAQGTNPSDGIVYLEASDATTDEGADPVDTISMTNVYGETTQDVTIFKQDADHNLLSGARFKLYYEDEHSIRHYYVEDNGTTSLDGTEETATVLTSNDQTGELVFSDLPMKTGRIYHLVEVEAPLGYQMLEYEVLISWDEDGELRATYDGKSLVDMESGKVVVTNSTGAVLPSTGGPGTTIATFGGAALIAAAGIGYGLRRDRERRGA